MCGKFTAMASWSEVVAFSQPLTADRDYGGEKDREVTFRVMGPVPLLIWDKEQSERRVIAARWGFPHPDDWRRPQPIHARAETIDTVRAFADAFAGRSGGRGLVLVKTFNEAPDSGEQHVFEPDAHASAIALVWRRFHVGAAAPLIAAVMVTVPANEVIAAAFRPFAQAHGVRHSEWSTGPFRSPSADAPHPTDRMPAILDPADWAKWIGEEPASPAEMKAMLRTKDGVNWKMRREYRSTATVREPAGMLF